MSKGAPCACGGAPRHRPHRLGDPRQGDPGQEPGLVRVVLVLQHHGEPGGRLRHCQQQEHLLVGGLLRANAGKFGRLDFELLVRWLS